MGELEGLALPLSSVRNDKPQPYVQLIREGRIVHTTVSLNQQGLQEGEAMFLVDSAASGLKAGDRVLRVQAGAIREGTAVVMAASAAPAPN
jgi:membrane fusion protein, multidrug efflux system